LGEFIIREVGTIMEPTKYVTPVVPEVKKFMETLSGVLGEPYNLLWPIFVFAHVNCPNWGIHDIIAQQETQKQGSVAAYRFGKAFCTDSLN